MSANAKNSRPKRLCTIKNGISGGRKPQGRIKKRPNTIGRLNDFCLLQIFNRLDLENLVNLTEVNNQFKRVSEMSFAGRYAEFTYSRYTWNFWTSPRRCVLRQALCKFGKSIKSLVYQDCLYLEPTELDAIPKFCAGGTLNELNLSTSKMMKADDCARLLFSSLKMLTLDYSEFSEHDGSLFSECQELKTLRLYGTPRCGIICDVAQKYGKLEELIIEDVNSQTTRALLQLNRQIKKLNMPGTYATTFAMVSKMVNLEELVIRDVSDVNCYNNIAKLAALKSLRVLEVHRVDPKYVTAFVGAMENVHSLERFECLGYYHDWQFANEINKLKTLKSLALILPELSLGDSFAELGGQLPLLHELKLDFECQEDVARSIPYLIKFVELSTTLEVLKIDSRQPELFNCQPFYDGLLKVIQKRQSSKTFKVTVCCRGSIAVNMHSNLLQVEVSSIC